MRFRGDVQSFEPLVREPEHVTQDYDGGVPWQE
jgi:hypothetical protein